MLQSLIALLLISSISLPILQLEMQALTLTHQSLDRSVLILEQMM